MVELVALGHRGRLVFGDPHKIGIETSKAIIAFLVRFKETSTVTK